MVSTHLAVFAEIDGIGSASGLFLHHDLLYIVGDNSGYLNEYHIETKQLNKIQILFDTALNQLENISKPLKPDFEMLCHHGDKLYILGSGSTAKRNLMVDYNLKTRAISPHDLTATYTELKTISNIDDENFNLEGAIFNGKNWLLFNRGNGNEAKNGIFKIDGADITQPTKATFAVFKLPNIKHIESTFTDAVLVGDDIFFISTVENTQSTYDDGEILGSFIGAIDAKTFKLKFSYRIPGTHKFEGITLLKAHSNQLEFLLCEDRDTEELKTVIYKLSLKNTK